MHTSPASGTVPLAVQWVRLDPGCEALAATKVLQPEAAWALQLERSQDVTAQSAAVQGLAALQPTTYGVVNALRACLDNPNVYCRCVATGLSVTITTLIGFDALGVGHGGAAPFASHASAVLCRAVPCCAVLLAPNSLVRTL